jgi:hypothetical protein
VAPPAPAPAAAPAGAGIAKLPAAGAAPVAAPQVPAPATSGAAGTATPIAWYRHRLLHLAVIALAVALAMVLLVKVLNSDDDGAGSGAGPQTQNSLATGPSAPASAPPSAPASAQSALPSAATSAAQSAGSGGGGGSASVSLPPGWETYTDPTGFTVAVPANWTKSQEGTLRRFREPGTGRSLGVDQTNHPKADPYDDWVDQEKARSRLSNYQRIQLVRVPNYFQSCADWEYTYTDSGGTRIHVLDRNIVTGPTHAYAIIFQMPDALWSSSADMFPLFAKTFQPAP